MQTPWKTGDPYPVVTITLEDGGVIKAELYPDKAPNTVNNFISLAKSGYFTGRVFHRAVKAFMIQGGSPDGTGTSAGFPYSIPGEFGSNGFAQNTLPHTPGVLSMARTSDPDSGGCQFFIMHGTAPFLNGQYAAFGQTISGMEVVDRIANMPVRREQLVNPPVIRSVEAETFGLDYPAPTKTPGR
jgi:peptidyl-prolyl cis-trans isomerase B (cyclophilin B)